MKLYAPVNTLVTNYRAKVKGLGNPAEKELTTALNNLTDDHKAWVAAQGR